jgi:hypothetical protein
MTEPVTEASARTKARLVGIFEILEGLTSTYAQVIVFNRLVVSGNAAATASNILAHEFQLRLGFVACFIGIGFHIAWALLFYDLFRSVNRNVSFFGLLIIVVGCGIQALAGIFYVAPLFILTQGNSLSAFTTEQAQALAFTFVKLTGASFNAYLVFHGLWCVVSGYLIFKSRFLPKILGLLLMLNGFGWMTYLSPPLGNKLFPIIAIIATVEIPLPWFFIFGFNTQRWKEQVAR